jgi:transcriptional regulator with GAF, ATPase, and Fis domain
MRERMETQSMVVPEETDFPHNDFSTFQLDNKKFVLFRKIQGAMRLLPDFPQTCRAILDAVIDEMDGENCSFMLRDRVTGELFTRAARGRNEEKSVYYSDPSIAGRRFKTGEGVAGWVLKEGRGMMVNDVTKEPRFLVVGGPNDKVGSLICFPIRERDQVVGVFNLSHSGKEAFGEGDRFVFSYISNQVGAALTAARFFLDIQEVNRLKKDPPAENPLSMFPLSSPAFLGGGEIGQDHGIFLYASDKMHRVKEVIEQVADTDVTVLIQGESGVGKEVVARSIHLNSLRRAKPFIKINCAALPHELLESELFGYEKGAFTGAYRQKPGKFELANEGTIFLDEIAEISPSLQSKLLQVLQDREFSRLGGKKDIHVDVRILVATNKNMEEAVKDGRFREDLYYRLNVVSIVVPPLRERKEEIPIFTEHFLNKFGKKHHKKVKPISGQMMNAFLQHPWLGNIRELENVIQRYIVFGNEEPIIKELAEATRKEPPREAIATDSDREGWPSLKEVHRDAVLNAESEMIRKALAMTNWNRKRAASILNISYKTLLYKIQKYSLDERSIPPYKGHPTSFVS